MSDSATTPAQDTATPSIDTQQLQQPPPPQSLVQDPQLHAQLHQNSQPAISDPPRKRMSLLLSYFHALLTLLPLSAQLSYPSVLKKFTAKAPAVRRACTSCHSGKTRCSEILPCQVSTYLYPLSRYVKVVTHHLQSCLKRGLGATCAYPDPEAPVDHSQQQTPGSSSLISFVPMSAEATCVAPGIPPFPAAPISYMQPPSLTHQQYYEYNGSFTGASTSTFRPNKRPRPLTEEEAAAITRNFSRGDFYIGTSAPIRIDPRLPVRLTLGEGDHVHFTIGETLV
jgi:hypothetical protein